MVGFRFCSPDGMVSHIMPTEITVIDWEGTKVIDGEAAEVCAG